MFKPYFNLIIAADFNVKFNYVNNFERDLNNLFDCFGLSLTTLEITRPGLTGQGNCIDNVVTDIHKTKWSSEVIHTIVSDHHGILFRCNLVSDSKPGTSINLCRPKQLVRIVNDQNVDMFIDMLKNLNWLEVYDAKGIEDKFKVFHDLFMWAVNGAFPLVTGTKNTKSDNKWYSIELRSLKEQCDELYRLSKIVNSSQLRDCYQIIKKEYKLSIKNAKIKYYNGLVERSSNKSRTMWQIANSLVNKNCNESVVQDFITPDSFNNFFIDHVSNVSSSIPVSVNDCSLYVEKYPRPSTCFLFQEVSVEKCLQRSTY